MTGRPGVRGATPLGRVLSDAERAAWAGDEARSRRFLRLADCLATGAQKSALLAAAESVRSGLKAGGGLSVARGPAVPLPRIRPVVDTFQEIGNESVVAVPPRGVTATDDIRKMGGSGRSRARAQLAAGAVAALALLGAGTWPRARAILARAGLEASAPEAVVRLLSKASDGQELVLRGDARLAMGDSAGAAADYVAAAAAAVPPGKEAMQAGLRLERLGAYNGAAADALLRAYAAGAGPEHWPRIAAVLVRAGRSAEAERVRRGVGRR